jgi:hypothetical protein
VGSIVSASIQPQFSASQVPSSSFLTSGSLSITEALSLILKNGTGVDQINLISVATYTFTGTTPQTANLQAMVDILGAAVNFARVKLILFKLYGTSTDGVTLTLGNAGATPWTSYITGTGTLILQAPSVTNANGAFHIAAAPNVTGWIVGSGNKSLLMTPSANCTLDIIFAGVDV